MKLYGLDVSDNKKWYCNVVDSDAARCCDVYLEDGSTLCQLTSYNLTGNEDWAYNPENKCYYFHAPDKYFDDVDGGQFDPMLCSHFRWSQDIHTTPLYMFCGGFRNEIQFNYDNGEGGLDNFIKWVKKQRTTKIPVEVVYVLKYPYYYVPDYHERTTIHIREKLMKSLRQLEKK